MSTFNGRRGPNVSQYLREMTAIKSQEATTDETFDINDDDLTLFTNSQFFDFDSGQNTDFQGQPVKVDATAGSLTEELNSATSVMGDLSGLDFISAEFNFQDFTTSYSTPSVGTFPDSLGNLQPLQPSPQAVYAPSVSQQQASYVQQSASRQGEQRSDSPTTPGMPVSFEDVSRVAAEEDKRRRNTAASARFRIKKKQREQALEKSAKEMTEKVNALEGRIQQLETENKWLKNLIMEKNDSSEDASGILKEFRSKQAEKEKNARKDGGSKEPVKQES